MAKTHKTQTLSFPIRLPDTMQAVALQLLDASIAAINQMITELWPQLDLFASDRTGPAWKQVERHLVTRSGHGSRQERCEMEQAGRILRAQASRKQVFATIVPLLSEELIEPAEGKRAARKVHWQIKERVRTLRAQMQDAGEDAEAFMAMTNLLEQACNVYLRSGAFPGTYEQLQPPPVLTVGHLTFAGDDGMDKGQTYRLRIETTAFCDLETRQEHDQARMFLKLRTPDSLGQWAWGTWSEPIPLPPTVCRYLAPNATTQAPTLREITGDDGRRVAVLDLILEVPAKDVSELSHERRVLGFDWGVRSLITVSILERPEGDAGADGDAPYRQVSRPLFLATGGIDGRQARLRREIDRLKARRDRYAHHITQALAAQVERDIPLPTHFASWQQHVMEYEARITQCWKTYERRNRELAHLAANLLILLALVSECRLICGENLTTLKTEGRGRGVRGRFRNWRNTTTVRGELWRVLQYKCHLVGIRTRQVHAQHTSHTCPHCHQPASTYASSAPQDRTKAIAGGPWLCCSNPACLWNGARDYAASLNIARLGMAFLLTYQTTRRYVPYRMADSSVKPCLYSRQGATLLLPSQGITPRPSEGKYIYYAGWSYAIAVRTSRPQSAVALLSTSQLRKSVLRRA
jgi:putative transposase